MDSIPTELNDMQAADITQLLREAIRRLKEAGGGSANPADCGSLAERIEAKLAKLGVDPD